MWKVDGSQTREGRVDWKTGPRINLQKAMEKKTLVGQATISNYQLAIFNRLY